MDADAPFWWPGLVSFSKVFHLDVFLDSVAESFSVTVYIEEVELGCVVS